MGNDCLGGMKALASILRSCCWLVGVVPCDAALGLVIVGCVCGVVVGFLGFHLWAGQR